MTEAAGATLHHAQHWRCPHRFSVFGWWWWWVTEDSAWALVYVCGAQSGKKHVLTSFWSAEWGYEFFKETMSHNRFQEIMWFLHLTKRRPVAEVWDRFVQNSIACYKPGADITVDEQLFPTKARCTFSQYIASKPNNVGIKWRRYQIYGEQCAVSSGRRDAEAKSVSRRVADLPLLLPSNWPRHSRLREPAWLAQSVSAGKSSHHG